MVQSLVSRHATRHVGGAFRRLVWLCVCLALSGCGYYAQPIAESEIHNEPQQELHTLSTGDEIEVRFTYWPELNEIQQIRPDGYVDLGIVNEVRAAGKTVPELTAELKTRYASTLKNPEISIVVRNYAKEYVYVGGEVLTPGLIALGPEMTALEAIMAAGGQLKASARMSGVILVRHTGGKRYAAAIDLAEQIDGKESVPVVLQPRDIVFVPRTPIDHIDQFVDQYINKTIPNTALQYTRSTTTGDVTETIGVVPQ
ncbi:polysaccharide biosynthesis/export family protein [Oceanidesulfovibrio marinus]|nr:polysaccharide biosynthesis/export family protein [Oceanidesulfovibrio marinus]